MKRALIIVDVQPAFITDANRYVVPNILKLLKENAYDAYMEVTFHAEKGSLWDRQQGWTCPEGPDTETYKEIVDALTLRNPIRVKKETRSAFKGAPQIAPLLTERGIEEVHIIGFDTDDCVLATAHEAFDLGFLPTVIEDCCESSAPGFHEVGLKLLRWQDMTDKSSHD